jgi:hypothetical protein
MKHSGSTLPAVLPEKTKRHYLVSFFNGLVLSFKVRGRGMQGIHIRIPENSGWQT